MRAEHIAAGGRCAAAAGRGDRSTDLGASGDRHLAGAAAGPPEARRGCRSGGGGAKSLLELVRAAAARKSLYFISSDEWTNIWEETRPKYANLSLVVVVGGVFVCPECDGLGAASRVFWDTHARTGMRCGNVRLLSLQLFLPIICTCLVPFFSENWGKIAKIALTRHTAHSAIVLGHGQQECGIFGVFNTHFISGGVMIYSIKILRDFYLFRVANRWQPRSKSKANILST